ncbi:MAG TPA: hypothetical protein VIL34_16740 [Actinopolymorphaceae bacterium]
MGELLLVIIVGLVVLVGAFGVRLREIARAAKGPVADAVRENLLNRPVDPTVVATVIGYWTSGRKILAVKALRDATGLGLADAKRLAEAIARGHRPPGTVIRGEAVDVSAPESGQAGATGSGARQGGGDLAQRARLLRDAGLESEAIKLVCAETGMGVGEAQAFVRALT